MTSPRPTERSWAEPWKVKMVEPLRMISAAAILSWGLRDREGLRSLGLLIFRDIASLITWLLAFIKRTTVWRGTSFILTRDGRLLAREVD